jgi:hypothetical protein
MDRRHRWMVGAGVIGTMAVAGALGPVVFGVGAAGAQSGSGTNSPPTSSSAPFRSNENRTHEQGENSSREGDENSGRFPGPGGAGRGAFHPNENPSHEQSEGGTREQRESSGQFPGPGGAADTQAPAPVGSSA